MMRSPAQQQGFILVASIWIMAILVLMVSAFAVWVESSLDKAITQNERANMQLAATSTRSVLLYLATSQTATPAGIKVPVDKSGAGQEANISLEDFFAGAEVDGMGARTVAIDGTEISVDGTVYKGIGGSLFSVMDLSGLIPLNSKSTAHARDLLRYLDIEQARISRLETTLQDYIDKDDVIGLNGAERLQYQLNGLKPPPNTSLLTRHELRRVMGWDTVDNLWDNSEILSAITASTTQPYNVNAMPRIVAKIAFGLSEADAERLISERNEKKFSNIKELMDRTELNLYTQFDKIRLTPSTRFRFSFWYPEARLKREIDVHFLPIVNTGDYPWVISRDLVVPILESDTLVEPRQVKTHLLR